MSDTQNSPESENAFAAPQAELIDTADDRPVLQLEQISAWFVFFVGALTLGIYNVYWLYTRTQDANELAKEHKVKTFILHSYVSLFIINFVVTFLSMPKLAAAIQITSFVVYLFLVFSLRDALKEIINTGNKQSVHLNGGLTFFFSSIYFQYKINEAIENQE